MTRSFAAVTSDLSVAGVWTPNSASDGNRNLTIAGDYYSQIGLANGRNGLVVDGWSWSGSPGTTQTFYPVNVVVFEQNANGTLTMTTEKYIVDSTTNGAGSVIVADFNADGRQDIFLAAYNESPFVAKPTTVYLSNSLGAFDKVILADATESHATTLTSLNGVPTVFTAVFDGNPNPYYQYQGGQFIQIQTPGRDPSNLTPQGFVVPNAGIASIAVADFDGNGQADAIVGDLQFGPGYQYIAGKAPSLAVYRLSDFVDANSNSAPLAFLTPYFNDKLEYAGVSALHGPGKTHIYRLFVDDFNHDGKPDVVAGATLWPSSYSMLQLLQNTSANGSMSFADKTDTLNKGFSAWSQTTDYSMQMIDIDNSGIKTYFLAGSLSIAARADGTPDNSQQDNYIFLNDGTGALHVYLHEEFQTIGDQVNAYAAASHLIGMNSYQMATQPSFIEYLTNANTINLVAQVSGFGNTGIDNATKIEFINVPLQLNPAVDYTENVTIADRNGSTLIRTWAGDDTIASINASLQPTHIDGGAGTDTLVYSAAASQYKLTFRAGVSAFTVEERTSAVGIDTLANIERVQFSNITLDATAFAKTALLTKAQIDTLVEVYIASFNRSPDALGLDYWGGRLKDGMNLEAIAKSFFSQPETIAKYPVGTTNDAFITTVYGNVLGRTPDSAGLAYWTGELASGHVTRDSFLLTILNGAHANPSATLDMANLNNKVAVGEHFALAQGLINGAWSQDVMSGVTSAASTVTAANALTDSYAAIAAAPETSQLVVKILGIVS